MLDNNNVTGNSNYWVGHSLKNIFGNKVESYILGEHVIQISNRAFYECSGMTSITIGNNVTIIGDYAFYGCSGLTSITIPGSVTCIGDYAFYYSPNLTSVISEIEEPFMFSSSAFSRIASTCTLIVPYGTKDAYIATGWTTDVFKGGIVEAPYNPASKNKQTITDAEVCKGKQTTLPVNMNNTESITALQFEVSLPEGVAIPKCQLTERHEGR